MAEGRQNHVRKERCGRVYIWGTIAVLCRGSQRPVLARYSTTVLLLLRG